MYSWKYICQENLKFTSQSSVSGEGLWVMGRPLPFDIPKTDGEPGVNAQEHRLGLDLGFPMKVTQKSCTRQCGRRNIWRLFGLWMDNYLPWCLTLVTCKQGQLSKFFFFFQWRHAISGVVSGSISWAPCSLVLSESVPRPRAHLQDVKLAVLPSEAPGGSVGREALTVRSQPVHVSIKNVAPKLPHRVIHYIAKQKEVSN